MALLHYFIFFIVIILIQPALTQRSISPQEDRQLSNELSRSSRQTSDSSSTIITDSSSITVNNLPSTKTSVISTIISNSPLTKTYISLSTIISNSPSTTTNISLATTISMSPLTTTNISLSTIISNSPSTKTIDSSPTTIGNASPTKTNESLSTTITNSPPTKTSDSSTTTISMSPPTKTSDSSSTTISNSPPTKTWNSSTTISDSLSTQSSATTDNEDNKPYVTLKTTDAPVPINIIVTINETVNNTVFCETNYNVTNGADMYSIFQIIAKLDFQFILANKNSTDGPAIKSIYQLEDNYVLNKYWYLLRKITGEKIRLDNIVGLQSIIPGNNEEIILMYEHYKYN